MSDSVWLLELAALDASDAAVTLRFSSGYYSAANDYDVRIKQPALFTISATGSIVSGSNGPGYGEAVLTNADGGLNYLADYSVDGRSALVKLVDPTGAVNQIISGTVLSMSFDNNDVSIRLRDPQQVFAAPYPYTVYGGTNALPAGVDGVSTDIQGQIKPQVLGNVRNVTPKFVNTSRLIYQVDTGTTSTITAVFDRGVTLTDGGAYASLAALQATAPAAGNFRAFQGYFRLGSTPAGEVTADVDSTTNLLGAVFSIIAVAAGYTVNSGDVTAANTIGGSNAIVGIYLDAATPVTDLLTRLADSMGGYWSFDSSNVIRLKALAAPGSSVLTLHDYEVQHVTRSATGAGKNGLPVWRVVCHADRVETVQTDVATTAVNRARTATQYRDAPYTSSATLTRHPLADEVEINSDLRSIAVAQLLVNALGALLIVRRDAVMVTARLDAERIAALSIGTTITLQTTKLGYSAGRNMLVIGYTVDARLSRVDLNLWG